MASATNQNVRLGKSDSMGVKLQNFQNALSIHSPLLSNLPSVPRDERNGKRGSFLQETCFLTAILTTPVSLNTLAFG